MTWPTVELGDVADVVMGQSPPGETYNENREGLPFFQGKADFGAQFPDVRKWCTAPKKVAELGDILLSVRAPVGPTNVARERSCIGRGLAAIRGNPERVDQNYLRLYLKHHQHTLALQGQGSTFSAIARADIETLSVPLPSLSEQHRVVAILDQADNLCRLRSEANETSERILAALFVRTFGDPATNPKGWKERTIGDVCQVISGGTPKTNREEYWGGSVAWATPKDLSKLDDWILGRTERTLTEQGLANSSATMLPAESVLLSSRAPIGLVAISGVPVCTNQGFKSLVCGPEVDPWYLFAWCKLRTRFLQSLGHGATFKEVSKRVVSAVPIPLPPMAAQSLFRAKMERLHEARQQARKAGARTNALFNQLLASAFSGSLASTQSKDASQTAEVGKPDPEHLDPKPRKSRGIAMQAANPRLSAEFRLHQTMRAIEPRGLGVLRSLEDAMGPLRRSIGFEATSAFEKASAAMRSVDSLNAVARRLSTDPFSDEIRKLNSLGDLANAHSSWIRDMESSIRPFIDLHARAQRALEATSRMTRTAAEIGGRRDIDRIVDRYGTQFDLATRSLASLDSLAFRFGRLARAAESLPAFTALPSLVLPGASRELLVAEHSLTTLVSDEDEIQAEEAECLDEIRRETEGIRELLGETDPALAKLYRGAKEALAGRSADRTRHALVSLRELWSHLLRKLAPDDEVHPWLADGTSDLTHNGRPTRRARLLYMCREFDHEPLDDFVESDSRAFLQYLDLFNRVHQLEPDFSDQQLQALVLRTDSWLLFLLQISREGRRC